MAQINIEEGKLHNPADFNLNTVLTYVLIFSFIAKLTFGCICWLFYGTLIDILLTEISIVINLVGIIGLLIARRWGLYVFGISFIFDLIISILSANPQVYLIHLHTTMYSIPFQFIQLFFYALLFLLPKYGINAYKIVWNNGVEQAIKNIQP